MPGWIGDVETEHHEMNIWQSESEGPIWHTLTPAKQGEIPDEASSKVECGAHSDPGMYAPCGHGPSMSWSDADVNLNEHHLTSHSLVMALGPASVSLTNRPKKLAWLGEKGNRTYQSIFASWEDPSQLSRNSIRRHMSQGIPHEWCPSLRIDNEPYAPMRGGSQWQYQRSLVSLRARS